MHVEDYKDGARERTILISMLTDDATAGMVASLFDWEDGGLFEARWSNTLASMAARYYKKYKKAPGRQIETLFAAWCDKHESDKATTKLLESFLSVLSSEYERDDKPAPDYVKDLAGEYFNKVRLKRLNAKISDLLDNGEVAEAEALMKAHRKIEVGKGAFLDIFNDRSLVEAAFATKDNQPLIDYPGDAAKFLANMLERDVFLAFQGPSKTGKSMFLIDLAYRAVCQRKRTVFFAVGDMSLKQMQHRFYARCARWPYRSRDNTWPHTVRFPTAIKAPPKPKKDEPVQVARVEFADREFTEPLSGENAWAACERLLERYVKSQESYFRLSVHPNNSISAEGIEEAVKKLIDEGFRPDVVCVAEGSLVLTDRGLVPIEKVRRSDRLWDGNNWVSHGGAVYKGVKEVITYAGLTATPDHQVWTDQGWRTLESCKREFLRVANTEVRGRGVRVGEGYISDSPCSRQRTKVRLCPLCEMRTGKMGDVQQHPQGNFQGLSSVPSTQTVPYVVPAACGIRSSTMHKRETQGVETLRGTWNRVSIQHRGGGVSLVDREFRSAEKGHDVGSHRQRRSLRAGEPSLLHSTPELFAHAKASARPDATQVQDAVPACPVCGRHSVEVFQDWNDSGRNRSQVEYEVGSGKKSMPVWDILNAGPLHRFTVQGILTHNCIDYADILYPINPKRETRDQTNETWKVLRRMSEEFHCLLVSATQTDAKGYTARTQTRMNFSEDKRKNDHANGIVGLNATDEDRAAQVIRWNWVCKREGYYNSAQNLYLGTCLDICNPVVVSTY